MIFEIVLGIVLAVVILALWPYLLALVVGLAVLGGAIYVVMAWPGVVGAVVVIGVLAWLSEMRRMKRGQAK